MNPEIFRLGLTTEAVSLYLILEYLVMAEQPLTHENFRSRWNGEPALLVSALDELISHGVVRHGLNELVVLPPDSWRAATGA